MVFDRDTKLVSLSWPLFAALLSAVKPLESGDEVESLAFLYFKSELSLGSSSGVAGLAYCLLATIP